MAPTNTTVRWSVADARALLEEIGHSPEEGLVAGKYDAAALGAAIDRQAPDLDQIVDHIALRLAHDYAEGAAPESARTGWKIGRVRLDDAVWRDAAILRHDLRTSLRALLPWKPAYAALRAALPGCDTRAHCLTIRVNMERWRWLPRNLGAHYVWVNPPAYRLDLIENDSTVSSHRVIVGKPSTPTPAFETTITAVTANPWWNVPQSIVAESIGALVRNQPEEAARRGYVATRDARGVLHVRQRPGATNALGLVKIEMPNPYTIYLHDTPSRDLFANAKRAYSHGCVRTERPDVLARILLPTETARAFDRLLAAGTNGTLPLAEPVRVYIVYLTAEPDATVQGGVRFYDDVYRRDHGVEEALGE